MGEEAREYPGNALKALLSRIPLDLDTGASHDASTHPFYTLERCRFLRTLRESDARRVPENHGILPENIAGCACLVRMEERVWCGG
jgi:hypothetical protein